MADPKKPEPPMHEHQKVARALLISYDACLAGDDFTSDDADRAKAVSTAMRFGAAAYRASSEVTAEHEMGRAFLLALIDPEAPVLDHLRG